MRTRLCVTLLFCVVTSSLPLGAQLPASDSINSLFAQLLANRTAVAKRVDTAAYRRLIDPSFVYIADNGVRETGDEHIRALPARFKELNQSRFENDSLKVYMRDGVAFVDYRTLQHQLQGTRDMTWAYRVSETYVRPDHQWLLMRHAEVRIISQPITQQLNKSLLAEYVGRYEWWPGYVDVISRRGNQLFNQVTGDAKAELNLAATPESFFIAHDPSLIVFIRDEKGHVIAYLLHLPDGQVIRARKLR